jgi:hypothetical protein
LPWFHILPARIQLLDKRMVPELLQVFKNDLPTGEPLVWVAIDTLSQTSGGADENDATQMAEYVGALERIREATGAFTQLVHHSGKDASRGVRGSSVLTGNFDTIVEVAQDDDGVATAKCIKQRGRWAEFAPFAFRVKSLALDEHGDETGPVLELCDVPTTPNGRQTRLPGAVALCYQVFLDLFDNCPEGVWKKEWRDASKAAGIAPGSFHYLVTELEEKYHKVYIPDTMGRYWPSDTSRDD